MGRTPARLVHAQARRRTAADEPGDRLFLLIGAGHVPILRHGFEASPEVDLVDVAAVLAPGSR